MRIARLVTLAALIAASLVAASASAAAPGAPTGLHGFLLRADEAPQAGDSFPRTPAFAWDPVPAATGYEFQLSTSRTFNDGDSAADNGIFYDTNSLTSPVAAPPLVLPWITGRPHALYARVRATTPDGVSAWSASYGFDLQPDPGYPTPLATNGNPGLLRWTPIEGADAYEVWLVDLPNGGKIVKTRTNVLDEREFYTFHGSSQWIGSVRWRVRAVRSIEGGAPANDFPVASYGKWSPIYKSTNPALTTGPLKLVDTISDVVETGAANHSEPAHKLMPAFTWSGDTVTLPNGTTTTAELFRVEVFSDSSCLNMVYAGPVVGGQSWAPRAFGGSIKLPTAAGIAAARGSYPADGGQGTTATFDGQPVGSVEDLGPAGATMQAPPDAIPAGASQAVTAPADGSTFAPLPTTATVGAPVDLWDTSWPDTGYYWTVMPVEPALSSATGSVAAPGASKGSTIVPVTDTSPFTTGQVVTIGTAPNSDTATITGVGNGLLNLSAPLQLGHAPGEGIVVLGGAGGYQDVMLPEDLCQEPGLRHEFGMWSEPTVSSPSAPFLTGVSTSGTLVSATRSTQFYGRTLVAWTPALRAEKYELEWSRTDKPFVAVGNLLTTSTAAVLPNLTAGNWYYRIRGFDYNLPAGAQQMAWSDVQTLSIGMPTFTVVTSPKNTFSIVGAKSTTKKAAVKAPAALRAVKGAGFTISVPKTWKLATKSGVKSYVGPDGSTYFTVILMAHDYRTEAALYTAAARKKGWSVATGDAQVAGGAAKVIVTANTKEKDLVYAVPNGSLSYLVFFASHPSSYGRQVALFRRMIATFNLG